MIKQIWVVMLVGLIADSFVIAQEFMTRGLYSLKKAEPTSALVSGVNLEAVKTNHLAEYEIQRNTESRDGEYLMVLYNSDTQRKVEMSARIFPSVSDAEYGALDMLNSRSAIFTNGTPSGRAIGDNAWYFMREKTGATTILFVRKNVVVSIFAEELAMARTLAETMDADILAGKNGIVLMGHK